MQLRKTWWSPCALLNDPNTAPSGLVLKNRWRAQSVFSRLSHHAIFPRTVCRSTGRESGQVTTEGKVMPFFAVVAIVVGRSLRVPHASTQNRTEARNSLKRKHMIRVT